MTIIIHDIPSCALICFIQPWKVFFDIKRLEYAIEHSSR
jgi:hypothetical protein